MDLTQRIEMGVDLHTCEAEPIHTPGRVQPHGVLLALREPDLSVVQASDNTADLFGVGVADLLGQAVAERFAEGSRDRLREALANAGPKPADPFCVLTRLGKTCDAVAHRHDGLLILELEEHITVPVNADRLVRFALARLGGESNTRDLCAAAAREVRALTGFDRVMVYRFDGDWNGEVIAEERDERLVPFLGLNYPASDIPIQARRLYTLNWIRHIPDVIYHAIPLVPADNPLTGRPTDLSFAALRSVSPIHVEYLQNMGVSASLSISVLKDGQLWGLIACHHDSPRRLPPDLRAACESVGVMMSLQLSSRLDADEGRCRLKAAEHLGQLTGAITHGPSYFAALTSRPADLLRLVNASGVAVLGEGRVEVVGETPSEENILRLIEWLPKLEAGEVVGFRSILETFGEASLLTQGIAGVLAACISAEHGEYVLWFRPEVVQTVQWAGDPHYKPLRVGVNGPRLSPRGSFDLWREEQHGRSLPWSECERDAARQLSQAVLVALARQSRKLAEEGRRKDVFLATLGHELRNPLAPMRNALHVMKLRGSDDPEIRWAQGVIDRQVDQLGQLIDELMDVSRVTQGKVRLRPERVEVSVVVSRAVETSRPLMDAMEQRLTVTQAETALLFDADTTRMTQVLVNLLNNASKYTQRRGEIALTVTREADEVVLRVRDNGVGIAPEMLPRLFDLFAQVDGSLDRSQGGLGVGLSLVRALVAMHGGSVQARSDGLGQGSEFMVRLPLAVGSASALPTEVSEAKTSCRRVLVVDDNRDAADSLAMLLRIIGHEVRTAHDGEGAVEVAGVYRPDVALLDIGLPGIDGYEAARRIRAEAWGREMLLVACTGWGQDEDRQRAGDAGFNRHLVKPVDPQELADVLASARLASG